MSRSCLVLIVLLAAVSSYAVEYVEAVAGNDGCCPLVELKGKIFQHTFPGVPNYQSVEEGDAPETRWVLEIPSSEIRRLEQAGFIPQNDLFNSQHAGWVQVLSPQSEDDPVPFLDHRVVVKGYLGCLIFHVHTPIAIEAIGIYDDR